MRFTPIFFPPSLPTMAKQQKAKINLGEEWKRRKKKTRCMWLWFSKFVSHFNRNLLRTHISSPESRFAGFFFSPHTAHCYSRLRAIATTSPATYQFKIYNIKKATLFSRVFAAKPPCVRVLGILNQHISYISVFNMSTSRHIIQLGLIALLVGELRLSFINISLFVCHTTNAIEITPDLSICEDLHFYHLLMKSWDLHMFTKLSNRNGFFALQNIGKRHVVENSRLNQFLDDNKKEHKKYWRVFQETPIKKPTSVLFNGFETKKNEKMCTNN